MEHKNKNLKMHILHVYADSPSEWNCSQWRCLTPSNGVNSVPEQGLTMKLVHVSGFLDYLNPAIQDIVAKADLIVFQRNIVSPEAYNSMQYWRSMGKPVLVDLDDAYHILPWSNPAHKFWLEIQDGVALQALENGLMHSDGLVAPNRLLLYDWRHVVDGYYLQNFADQDFWPEDIISNDDAKAEVDLTDRIVIGWGGSVSHLDSWHGSGILDAAKRVTERHPKVMWMLCGNDPRIYRALPVSKSNKFSQKGVNPAVWPQIVKRFDIGLAPLFGPYDQRRSWIKGLEYQLAGVPWIATDGEPYRDFAEQNLGTHVRNSVDNWEEALENHITNIVDLKEQAQSQMEMSRQWLAVNQVEHIKSVYKIAIDKFTVEGARLPGVHYVKPEDNGEGSAEEASTAPEVA